MPIARRLRGLLYRGGDHSRGGVRAGGGDHDAEGDVSGKTGSESEIYGELASAASRKVSDGSADRGAGGTGGAVEERASVRRY